MLFLILFVVRIDGINIFVKLIIIVCVVVLVLGIWRSFKNGINGLFIYLNIGVYLVMIRVNVFIVIIIGNIVNIILNVLCRFFLIVLIKFGVVCVLVNVIFNECEIKVLFLGINLVFLLGLLLLKYKFFLKCNGGKWGIISVVIKLVKYIVK